MKRTPKPSTPAAPTPPNVDVDVAPPTPDVDVDDLDAESAVSVAFERVWVRAKTEVAGLSEELRTQYARLDALVILLALCMIWLAARWHRALVTPPLISTTVHGLRFARTSAWHEVAPIALQPTRLVRDTPEPLRHGEFPYHVVFTSTLDEDVRMELFVDERPAWSNLAAVLELQRRVRYGTMYQARDSGLRTVAGHDWLRTEYRFGDAARAGAPRLGSALEYATIDREHVYVVTWIGSPAQLARLEGLMAPTLRVASHTGMPLLPQIRHIIGTEPPPAVVARYPSIVMIVVADIVRGQLRAVGGGSGVIVGADGSVLTNFHVVHDKGSRLHDLFVIARYEPGRLMPQMACVGRPNRGKLLPDHDLALIKCDADLDGRAWWATQRGEPWPALPASAPRLTTELGQPLWVLGYPDVGGGTISVNPGAITGFTGDAAAHEYIKTDAAITQGNSGGPVFDEAGALLGLATAYRTVIASDGVVSETTKIGLVRPIAGALDLLFIAQTGWTPREGRTALAFAPEGVEVPAEGALLRTTVISHVDRRPVGGAIVMVLRPGVSQSSLDMNRLEDSIMAWGQAGEDGAVAFRQPVPAPGTYSVLVLASGYQPRFSHHEITIPADAPPGFNPWGAIEMRPFGSESTQ